MSLFIALPGIGVELALLRYHIPASPWERLAVIGVLGLAASGLVSLLLVATGTGITAISVGVACASISLFGLIISRIMDTAHLNQQRPLAPLRLALPLVVIISGGLIGSAIETNQGADPYTILALEDPLQAADTVVAMTAHGGETTVGIVVESHELVPEEYQLSVVGEPQYATFTLEPDEHRVMQVDISGARGNFVEIQLWKSGRVYRSLHLTRPDPSTP